MDDTTVQRCRDLRPPEVAERLQLPEARERQKWGCPNCGSSDALHVYEGRGRGAYCFSCDVGFDAIALVETALGYDFKEAVRWLAESFGFGDLKGDGADETLSAEAIRKRREKRRRERERRRRERRREARPIWDELWQQLELGPQARDYLKGRAIPEHVAEHVGLRSVESDDAWRRLRNHFWPDDLKLAGLLGEKDGETYPLPWSTPFLVVPYWLPRDHKQDLDCLRFRLFGGRGDGPTYLSPLEHEPERPYADHAEFDGHETLYICEGELDCLSVTIAGGAAIASPGMGAWSPEWCDTFRWYRRVVVLCDGDEAGREFSRRVRECTVDQLGSDWADQRLERRLFQDGYDANDALQRGILEDLLCPTTATPTGDTTG